MKPALLIHGTCQGAAMQQVLQRTPAVADHFEIKCIESHLLVADDWDTTFTSEFFANVRVLWDMAESGRPQQNRLTLHLRLPPGCQLLRWCSFNSLCLFPFTGNDRRLAADPEQRYPWQDSVAASLAGITATDEELFTEYMALSERRMPNLDRMLARDVTRWQALDRLADVENTQFILDHLRKVPLFHTAGHVTARPLQHLLHGLMALTCFHSAVDREAARREIDTLLLHHAGQDFQSVPLHPLVAERLGLEFYDPNARHRWMCHAWTFREYIVNYIRWAPFVR